ncbi:MAG: monofunctional biosynthetic peptidoglycan transglycosylase [Gammaproteobacteria bacterium]|nr:monofunctional biosynthetic peptidoglycan transglycosylase [Gammaproteobacteria bacterium]
MMFWRKKSARRPAKQKSSITLWLWRAVLFGFLLVALDVFYLAIRLPAWNDYAEGPIKKSRFIERYETERAENKEWPALMWRPVPIAAMPRYLIRAVIIAEDSRFYSHNGFDTEAIQDALEHDLAKRRFIYGGSTLSQQTVKNMFFSASRNPLRKLHELVFTYSMEQHLKKRRIMEIYLNIAEFGRGIFGVEAAAQRYFHKPVNAISENEAIELAATLPGPVLHNPATRTRFFLRHKQTIERHYASVTPTPAKPAGPSQRNTPPALPADVPQIPQDEVPTTPDDIQQPSDDPLPVEITP